MHSHSPREDRCTTDPRALTISLLHATYHSPVDPSEIRCLWLERATHPERVEYIFAMDDDDPLSVTRTQGYRRCLVGPGGQYSTSARNWNAAASLARGKLLFVIADDLRPPISWDVDLERICYGREPESQDFAVKIQDCPDPTSTLLRHPIVSRAFYDRLGLFHPNLHGLFCDNDITLRAFWQSTILDGRSLVFEHLHPAFHPGMHPSTSQRRQGHPAEWKRGNEIWRRTWPLWQRRLPVACVSAEHHGRHPETPSAITRLAKSLAAIPVKLFRSIRRRADLHQRSTGSRVSGS